MECPFCCFLRDYVGQFVRIGVVCGCDTNDHIYRDGYIKRNSFYENTISLFDSPVNGDVVFTACCDDIFELYIFNNSPGAADIKEITDVATMMEQRHSLLKSVQGQGSLQKEETAHE
jgi:hypothetical protein